MNEAQLQAMLQLAAGRLQTTPEKLRTAIENGNLEQITGQSANPQAAQLKKILNDPEAAKKLLSGPAAQQLFKALGQKPQ